MSESFEKKVAKLILRILTNSKVDFERSKQTFFTILAYQGCIRRI